MPEQAPHRLLSFARNLLRASDLDQLLSVTRDEVQASLGYQHAWLMAADDDAIEELRLLQFSGERASTAWSVGSVLKVSDHPLLEALRASDAPVVVEDARLDPRTDKRLVQRLGCRTIVNIPLRLLDTRFGLLGVGTFGDEGCRVPTADELTYLVGVAAQVVAAAGRLRVAEQRDQAEQLRNAMLILERRLTQLQRQESVGTMAGLMAHDFDDLLTLVLSSATFMEEGLAAGAPPAKLERDVQAITIAAGRARELTRRLLTMSGQRAPTLAPLDLNQRLRGLVTVLEHTLPKNIAVDLIGGANLPVCEGDGTQLNQLFMNLFLNARDTMPGGGRLTIETQQVVVDGAFAGTHPWAEPGRYVLVTVTDTGGGVSPQLVAGSFEPFFTTRTDHTSEGRGLSIAYGIVRRHGGMLQCHSEPGLGSSFRVYLPAAGPLAAAADTRLVSAVPRAERRERILIAEDDDAVRAVAVRILEQAGYQVLAVDDGDAAVATARRESFEVAILDTVMPGLPCRQVLERIRAVKPDAPLLLASGYTPGMHVFEWLSDANLELLRKPYDPDQLLLAVRHALDRRKSDLPPRAGR